VPLPTPQGKTGTDIKTRIRKPLGLQKQRLKGKTLELEITLIQKTKEGKGRQ
jgi:hypothetical protein